ncbi:MAG: VapB-type antitoxin [Thermoprotei archaeon]|nr:MAG: VapB-type antitoxin [Thermoprotei archaeon]
MPRTIQVRDETYRALEKLKRRLGARSFDEVIEKLVLRELGLPEDMFGVDRGRVSPFSERDRMEDREW